MWINHNTVNSKFVWLTPPPPLRLSTTPLIFFSTLRVSLLTQLLSLNSSENLTLICWNTLDVFVPLICVCVFVLYNWVTKVLKVHRQPLFRCSAMAIQMGRRGKRGRTTNGNTTVILARKNKEVFLLVLFIGMVGSYLRLNQDKAITPFTSLTILTYLDSCHKIIFITR